MKEITVHQQARARIPTDVGEFHLCYYANNLDQKEHLALIFGDVRQQSDVLVRVHSECFTGDVLGSLRCDCGPQLHKAMRMIAEAGSGIIIYLRQEGRGIGLLNKLLAYNLQDDGYDTVDANLMLGHQADERDYTIAARILEDLGIQSIQLITNNPTKIESLTELGLVVSNRVPIATGVHPENAAYLQTKIERMRHLLSLDALATVGLNGRWTEKRPLSVTLSYAQSLDGSITLERGMPTAISGPEAMRFTHQLRASHDAILVGIGTVLADDPQLTVRLVDGPQPQPVILDSYLRTPVTARLFSHPTHQPWIVTSYQADADRRATLEAAGCRIFPVPVDANGRLDLRTTLDTLAEHGVQTVMVEGGATVIASFLQARLVNQVALTITPRFLGGLNVLDTHTGPANRLPTLQNVRQRQLGNDFILTGDAIWPNGHHATGK